MKHFNGLSPAQIERLGLLSEEMGEALQVIGKILRYGFENKNPDDKDHVSNRIDLAIELGHVKSAMDVIHNTGDIDYSLVEIYRNEKHEKLIKYLRYNENQLACFKEQAGK